MSNTDINALLSQMRTTAGRLESSLPSGSVTPEASPVEFKHMLKDSIESVNKAQQAAATMKADFEQGDPDANLTEVMLQVQKADLSFRAMTEVRNKLVNAYQEIMNMPV
ncbi:MAG: flagellar hook-basal body complex protein FliE [Gammaproteobacteria bacterium]